MTFKTSLGLLCISILFNNCSLGQENSTMHKYTNELIEETSPYLLQHAHNPVNWHAWNEKNLKEAKKLDKPLLISIGYSSCHWCHVMEHESFEDEEVASYMNANFYCIKVDREERPDVDQIYMTAANIITGSGGWPLNCFALPDGRPFHAGTYFPKNNWLRVLEGVHFEYSKNRNKLEEYADKLTQGIRLQETAITDNSPEILRAELISESMDGWKTKWDMQYGGMKGAPKFPMPINLECILYYANLHEDQQADEFVQQSLNKMAFGGIFDQIKGGFSRYSTDGIWKAPHFEKMLYDNAQLLSIYSKAYKKSKNPLYLEVINKTIAWLESEMLDPSGLFYSALDADSEGEEGRYYVWSKKQLHIALDSLYPIAESYYSVNEIGAWELDKYILMRSLTTEEVASIHKLEVQELQEKILQIESILNQFRNNRVRPGLDDKCLSGWNGLLLSGLVEAYKVTENTHFLELAENIGKALIKNQIKSNKLYRSYKAGISSIDGMLEDYVFVSQGLLDLYTLNSDEQFLKNSQEVFKLAFDLFYDEEKEIFYFNTENELIVRTAEIHDNVIPSSNSAMVQLMYTYGLLEGNQKYMELAQRITGKVQKNIASYPSGHANWSIAHMRMNQRYSEVVITGKNAENLYREMMQLNLPNTIIIWTNRESQLAIFKGRLNKTETSIYVCNKGSCKLPVKSIEEALQILN